MKYTIYTRADCMWCEAAKKALEIFDEEYEEIKIGVDITREQVMEKFPGVKSIPIILVDGAYIGGYDALTEHFQKQQYQKSA